MMVQGLIPGLEIEVVRIGQRVVRDDRVTTHVALVSRAFGAKAIFMTEVNPEIKDTVDKINKTVNSISKKLKINTHLQHFAPTGAGGDRSAAL